MKRALLVLTIALLQTTSAAAQSLDFQTYKTQVEPIFLRMRPNNGPGGSCFMCHTKVVSRLRLQPVSGDKPAWTEEQSRLNFEAVTQLVVPGDPLKSKLLLHPLAPEAGGDPIHGGGKHWQSQADPEWQTLAAWVRTGSATTANSAAAATLDFEVFRTRIQPIFTTKREGLARCSICHSQTTNFRLQKLPPGRTAWNDEESRRNFDAVQRLVVSGDPLASRLLMMPLAAEAGGDPFHPGGKHWVSRDDPEWQALAAWVRGQAR